MAVTLSRETLTAFDRALTDRAPAARALLREGSSTEDIRAQLRAAGVEPSDELTLWWNHFGGPPSDFDRHPLEFLPDLEFLSPAVAVRAYGRNRDVARQLASTPGDPQADEIWNVNWIPLFGILSGGTITVDCGPEATQSSPVRVVYPDEASLPEYARTMAPSLGTLIAEVTAWLTTNTARYSADRHRWLSDESWTSVGLTQRFRA
jgi:hypothetical protein